MSNPDFSSEIKYQQELIEKLKIASKRAVYQLEQAQKAFNEIEFIASSIGFNVDKKDGSLYKNI